MVSNTFLTVFLSQGGRDRLAPLPWIGGNRAADTPRFGIITALIIIVGVLQSAALGQIPDPFLAQESPPQAAIPYPPPVYGANTPMLAQNTAVQLSDTAQRPATTSVPKPEEKKEGEKTEKGRQERRRWCPSDGTSTLKPRPFAQGDPGFPAKYSGPNSLNSAGERQETLAADLFAGVRLWNGAEMHADALMWQGFGLSNTFGIEAFPNGDAYKAGTEIPDFMFAHLFIRQTFGLGGEQEDVPDGQLTLAGKQDISRLTFTVGRFTPTDIFDNNTYANDPHTQFLNWADAATSPGITRRIASDTPRDLPWN